MELTEYARMDAVEDHMWWYRALHRRLVAALTDVHGHVLDAGCGTGGLLARLPSVPDLERSVWSGPSRPVAAPPTSPAHRSCAAASMRCHSHAMLRCRDRRRSAVPWRSRLRRRLWPNCGGCCGRAAG